MLKEFGFLFLIIFVIIQFLIMIVAASFASEFLSQPSDIEVLVGVGIILFMMVILGIESIFVKHIIINRRKKVEEKEKEKDV